MNIKGFLFHNLARKVSKIYKIYHVTGANIIKITKYPKQDIK